MDPEAARKLVLDYLGQDLRFTWDEVHPKWDDEEAINVFRVFNGLRRLKPSEDAVCLNCGCTFKSWDITRNRLCYKCKEENADIDDRKEVPIGSLDLVLFPDSSNGDGTIEYVVRQKGETL